MANIHKAKILDELKARFGALNRLADSQSLFSIGRRQRFCDVVR